MRQILSLDVLPDKKTYAWCAIVIAVAVGNIFGAPQEFPGFPVMENPVEMIGIAVTAIFLRKGIGKRGQKKESDKRSKPPFDPGGPFRRGTMNQGHGAGA